MVAGPLRIGPGRPAVPFTRLRPAFDLPGSRSRRPAVPFTRLRPAFDLPGSRSRRPAALSLDCVPLSTCPALEASAGRSHRQRRPGRIAGGGGVCLRWGMNSFGAVCEWGCEGSERPGLRSGSGNSESEAGSGPASPAIAGGPQPSAAKARNSLQSLPPFAGCAREPPLPSASRDPAPSTCLPSNGPVHFPPENRFAHLLPEHRPCLPLDLLPPENRSRSTAAPFFSTNHGNRSPPARPIFAVSGPAVRRPLSGKQSLGRPLPAAARRIVGRNYCRRHSRPPASSLRRPAGIFPKPTSRIAPLAALADGSQASQAPATVTSALSEVRLKKPPRSIGRAPRRFPENSIPQPVTGPNRSFGPASACPYRRTAVPPAPVSRPLRSSPPRPPPRKGGYITKKAIVDRSLSVLSYQDSNLE